MSVYMKIDGVTGTIENGPFEGYFPVSSCQWGSGKAISDGRWGRRRRNKKNDEQPAENKRTCSDPSFSEMTISKPSDGMSAVLMASVGLNQAFDKVTIEVANEDGFVTTQMYVTYQDEPLPALFDSSQYQRSRRSLDQWFLCKYVIWGIRGVHFV